MKRFVLHVRERVFQFPGMVIINDRDRAYRFVVPGLPLLFHQGVPDHVPYGL